MRNCMSSFATMSHSPSVLKRGATRMSPNHHAMSPRAMALHLRHRDFFVPNAHPDSRALTFKFQSKIQPCVVYHNSQASFFFLNLNLSCVDCRVESRLTSDCWTDDYCC